MRSNSAALPFIMVTLLLDVLGFGLIIPVLPGLVTGFGRTGDLSESSHVYGLFIAAYGLMQFVFSPMLGALSDMYGRRPIILLSTLGAGLDYLLMAFAPSLEWLFVGRIISGLTGANITAVNAYVADVTAPEKRAGAFGMIGACFGIGFILGPAAGGLLADFGPRAPFIAAAVMNLINSAYGFLVLPESLPLKDRKQFEPSSANPFRSLGMLRRYPVVLGLTLTVTLLTFAQQGMHSTWVLYTTFRFDWTPMQNGFSLAVVGICAVVVQGGLTRVLVPKLGERMALLVGMSINAAGMLGIGLATAGWMLYAILVVTSVGGIAGPAAQALISRHVAPNEQGTVQGAVTSLMSLTGVVAPVFFTFLFGHFTSKNAPIQIPGASFIAGAVFITLAVFAAIRSFRKLPEVAPASVVPAAAH